MKVLTGIVTFNPDIDRLRENLSAVVVQDTDILIFDNGSINYTDIVSLALELRCRISHVEENKGIAYGLKYIMSYAMQNCYDWVLSLDQDSISNKELINRYKEYIGDPQIGALTCNIKDRNFVEISKPIFEGSEHDVTRIQKCITSGCFMRVSAYTTTDGYDVSMFIDFVDFDICYALLRAGYQIIKIPFDGLLHEDGHGKNVSFFGKKYIMYNKSAWRRYYMTKNEIYLARKFPEYQSPFRTTIRCLWQSVLILIYEEDKINKFIKGIKGIYKGITMKIKE
ncbi:glycosyltransferase [Megasphaera sp. An286]|uniref:glycosyltransferase n=1 Tax=Megasphaera sp. An286 TaxID=1965622 RepID=UPI000B3BB0A2|nr:glycosyltransferase [Megasphaera sp. An286]OUO45674.1 hypothetical protein B5F80_07995 [Megasphaera sp. An286]